MNLFIHSDPIDNNLTDEAQFKSKVSKKKEAIDKNIPMQLPAKKGVTTQSENSELKTIDPNL